jgi:uncharacterized protein YhjY with autotransporter beta-barrel domain
VDICMTIRRFLRRTAVVISLLMISELVVASAYAQAGPPVGGPGPAPVSTAPSTSSTGTATTGTSYYTPPPHRDYASYADTAGGSGIGGRLTEIAGNAGSGSDWRTILNTLDGIPADEVGETLDRLGPGESDGFTGSGLIAGRGRLEQIRSHLDERARNIRTRHGGKWMGWAEGSDGHYDIPDGDCKFDVAGVSCGVERDIGDSLLVGITVGMSHTRLGWENSGSEGTSDAGYVGSYGTWQFGSARIEAGADYGNSQNDTQRHIRLGDVVRIAESGFDGHPYAAFVGGSYDWRGDPWRISPMLSVSYVGLREDGYTETGAGSLDLTVGDRRNASAQAGCGLRVSREIHAGWLKLVPAVKAQWGRELKTGARDTNARFADVSESTFTMNGPESPADNSEIGASIDAYFMGATAYVRYDHTFGDWNSYGYTTSAGLRLKF